MLKYHEDITGRLTVVLNHVKSKRAILVQIHMAEVLLVHKFYQLLFCVYSCLPTDDLFEFLIKFILLHFLPKEMTHNGQKFEFGAGNFLKEFLFRPFLEFIIVESASLEFKEEARVQRRSFLFHEKPKVNAAQLVQVEQDTQCHINCQRPKVICHTYHSKNKTVHSHHGCYHIVILILLIQKCDDVLVVN